MESSSKLSLLVLKPEKDPFLGWEPHSTQPGQHARAGCSESNAALGNRLFHVFRFLGDIAAIWNFVRVDLEPLFLEFQVTALAFGRIFEGHVGPQRNDGITHGDFRVTTDPVVGIRVANAISPVLDLFAIPATDRP